MKDHLIKFKCDEDLEAVILHENKDAFAAIINNDLYGVAGNPPDQNILFHSNSCFDLFCIHVFELLVENKVQLPNGSLSLSVFTGARWLVDRHKDVWDSTEFMDAYQRLDEWLKEKPKFSFWCGGISKQIEFNLSRRKVLRFAQLLSKHNLSGSQKRWMNYSKFATKLETISKSMNYFICLIPSLKNSKQTELSTIRHI